MTLLDAVADTLVRIENDGTLRARWRRSPAVEAREPGDDFAAWSRAERESLLGELLAEPDAAVTVPPCDRWLHITNGGVNSILTILALAWRVSEHLAEDLRLNALPGWGRALGRGHAPASDEERPRALAPPLPVPCIGTALAL